MPSRSMKNVPSSFSKMLSDTIGAPCLLGISVGRELRFSTLTCFPMQCARREFGSLRSVTGVVAYCIPPTLSWTTFLNDVMFLSGTGETDLALLVIFEAKQVWRWDLEQQTGNGSVRDWISLFSEKWISWKGIRPDRGRNFNFRTICFLRRGIIWLDRNWWSFRGVKRLNVQKDQKAVRESHYSMIIASSICQLLSDFSGRKTDVVCRSGFGKV